MARVLATTAIAVFLSVGMAAQQEKGKERTRIETDDAKVVTWTGCLRASGDGFDLTEVTGEAPRLTKEPTREGGKKLRTPAMVMLRQVPAGLNLQQYVGKRVAITGATEDDVFEDIEVEVRTERTVKQKSTSDGKAAKKTTEIEADPRGHNILVPVSIREVSGTCR
jgi:hypothetical protein